MCHMVGYIVVVGLVICAVTVAVGANGHFGVDGRSPHHDKTSRHSQYSTGRLAGPNDEHKWRSYVYVLRVRLSHSSARKNKTASCAIAKMTA